MADLLFTLIDRQFKQEVRMDKNSFVTIVDILAVRPVFHNNSHRQQTPVWIQCLVVFKRLGCYGNANSLGANGRNSGFSEGAVVKFTDRVTEALLSIQKEIIKWPDEAEQIRARIRSKYGINGGVGIIDGTPVIFSQRPDVDGETYFSRKGVYCINLQLVCDDRGKVRFYICISAAGPVVCTTILYSRSQEYFECLEVTFPSASSC